jgi:hypothetical protein
LPRLSRVPVRKPELTDAYAALYAAVRLNDCCGSGESILATSTRPNCSLAMTAPLMGQTTLPIDGDQRRPWLAASKGITRGIGLCSVLEGPSKPVDATRAIEMFEDTGETGLLNVMSARRRAPAFMSPRVRLDGVLLVVGVGNADKGGRAQRQKGSWSRAASPSLARS